jgi:hypothetical protein
VRTNGGIYARLGELVSRGRKIIAMNYFQIFLFIARMDVRPRVANIDLMSQDIPVQAGVVVC